MTRERKHTSLPLDLLLAAALFAVVNAQAYFRDEPMVRFSAADPIDRQVDDLFGYATVIHRLDDSASQGDFDSAIANTR